MTRRGGLSGGARASRKPLLTVLARTQAGEQEADGLALVLRALRLPHECLVWAAGTSSPPCGAAWVWILESGERPDGALLKSVERALAQEEPGPWAMRRVRSFLGAPMRHGAWRPDERVCLFPAAWALPQSRGEDWGLEALRSFSCVRSLDGLSQDDRAPDMSAYLRRMNQDSSRRAEALLAREGACPSLALARMLVFPPLAFLDAFLWSLGLLDGEAGLNLALLEASAEFWTAAKWWHRSWKAKGGGPGEPWFLKAFPRSGKGV